MKITTNILLVIGFLCISALSKAQGVFDPVLTYPPSPGPLTFDTTKYPETYKSELSKADFRTRTHTTVRKRKLSEKEVYEKRKREEDKAWEDFINQPASLETKFAPKYIDTKTGK